jgi:hypothetical protein
MCEHGIPLAGDDMAALHEMGERVGLAIAFG